MKYTIFQDNIATLKELSEDKRLNDEKEETICYMTDSTIQAINFDKVKTRYTNSLGLSEESAKSVDALVTLANVPTFIEFKNGKMKNEKRTVKDKLRDSLLMYCDITETTISDSRENVDFILVYNQEKNPMPHHVKYEMENESPSRVEISKHFLSKAGKELIRFDLEKYKRLYFRDIHTYSKEEFELYLEQLQ